MDLIMIKDHMDLAGAGVGACQLMQESNEQITTLVHPFAVGQTATVNVQSSSEVTLFIDSWSLDPFLLAAQHIVRPDLRVQINIHFVRIDDDLVGSGFGNHLLQLAQTPAPTLPTPRAAHKRLRASAADAEAFQPAAHRRSTDAQPGKLPQNEHQQLLCPGRPPAAEIARRVGDENDNDQVMRATCFGVAVVGPAVQQTHFLVGDEFVSNSIDQGACAVQDLGDECRGTILQKVQNDENATTQSGVITLTGERPNFSAPAIGEGGPDLLDPLLDAHEELLSLFGRMHAAVKENAHLLSSSFYPFCPSSARKNPRIMKSYLEILLLILFRH